MAKTKRNNLVAQKSKPLDNLLKSFVGSTAALQIP